VARGWGLSVNDLEAGTTVRRTKWPAAGAINLDEAWKQAVASIVAEHTQGLLLDGDLVPRRILAPVREVRRPSNGGPGTSNQLASKSRPYLPYEIVELRSGHRNVLPIKVEHFKLLAPETLVRRFALDPDEGEIAVEKILNDGWILLAPRWGAVARFLDKTAAGWYKKKNVRECTGLYTGLQSLRSDLIPRVTTPGGGGWGGQVMIVHGDENVVDGYRQLRIRQDPTRRPFVALTGLFLDKVQLDRALPSDQERWRLIWERAQAIWSPNANPPASTRIGTSR